MKKYILHIINIRLISTIFRRGVFALFLVSGLGSYAQVSASIDSTTIKIGEEVRYSVKVETEASQVVVFPEGKTFSPLEIIESFTVDTAKNGNRFRLLKEYTLTQFDSGHYTIPRQKVMIGDQVFFTDSLEVEVRDIVVDTTKQKIFANKPLVEVDADFSNWKKYILWGIAGILVVGLIFLLVRRKKRAAAKEKELPPYEKAMQALHRIDESSLLEEDSHKEYYSQLSDTARKYIDEEVYDHAMESTTDELIAKLEEEIKFGSLNLDKNTIQELKKVLMTADMAKFAKSKPDIGTARADRNVIEQVITKTKSAIPEPTEEELLADEEYRRTVAEKKKRNKIIIISAATIGAVMITLAIFIAVMGYHVVKDTLLGHPTKELAENEWISSTYGAPPVTISTPEVLIRNNYQLTEEQKQVLKGNESFVYGSMIGDFYVVLSTVQYKGETKVDLEKAVEGIVGSFEAQGAKNISVKTEEYKTLAGAEGIKVFGSLEVINPMTKKTQKNDYLMLNFAEKGGFQQITIVYDIEDRYAKDVAIRIINSVELKSAK